MEAALAAGRFLHIGALLLVFGALAFPHYALTGEARAAAWAALATRRRLVVACLLALCGAAAWFVAVIGGMADDPAAALSPTVLAQAMTGTAFAPLWTARAAALILLTAAVWFRPGAGVTLALAGGALASLALTGHAQAEGGAGGALHGASDAVHLLTAGLWLGALGPLAGRLARGEGAEALATVRRFSAVAVPAVAALVATGALQVWLLAGMPTGWLRTGWGRLLVVKLALVAAMVALASYNRWRLTPALDRGDGSALRRTAAAELALGVGVTAVVAVLGTLSPTG